MLNITREMNNNSSKVFMSSKMLQFSKLAMINIYWGVTEMSSQRLLLVWGV